MGGAALFPLRSLATAAAFGLSTLASIGFAVATRPFGVGAAG